MTKDTLRQTNSLNREGEKGNKSGGEKGNKSGKGKEINREKGKKKINRFVSWCESESECFTYLSSLT